MMSLFRPSTRRPSPERSPLLGPGMRRTSSRSVGQKSADRGDLSRMPTGNGRLPSVDEADGNEDDPEEAMDNDGGVEAEDDEDDEDGPLLPIELFSTAYLGMTYRPGRRRWLGADPPTRLAAGLRPDARDPPAHLGPMRDLVDLGPAQVATGVAVPRQADSAADTHLALFPGDAVRADDQLPAVRQGSLHPPEQQRHQSDQGSDSRAPGDQIAQGVYGARTGEMRCSAALLTGRCVDEAAADRYADGEVRRVRVERLTCRGAVDALSYDFYPLQGRSSEMKAASSPTPYLDGTVKSRSQVRVGRVSALEVAIRAQAKRFLAHPVVVQQLEAIWAGTVVFHSAADNLHRLPRAARGQLSRYERRRCR